MAKKTSWNPTPALFADLVGPVSPAAAAAGKPLPPSSRPLFLPRLLEEASRSKQIEPSRRDEAHAVFLNWLGKLREGALSALSESQLEQEFTKELLSALGYTSVSAVPQGSAWTMVPKWTVPGEGIADVALGRFELDERKETHGTVIAYVELKSAGTDLDRKIGGRSPVTQAWGYLNASDESAQWAIVTDFVEFRLYNRRKTKNHLHRVLLTDLEDSGAFAEFYAVFHAASLLGTGALAHNALKLLQGTEQRQETVGEELYDFYAENRLALIRELRSKGVADLDLAIRTAQRLLDRVLFIAFAEDRQLIRGRTLESTGKNGMPGLTPWNAFQYLFRAVDKGDQHQGIPGYNGSLFKADPYLDNLDFQLDSTRWPQAFRTIGGFDYRHEVTVDVLGRIFERSITDIEQIKAKSLAEYEAALAERRKKPGRRKLHGVYYTDAAIVGYLVHAALDPAWDARRAELEREFATPVEEAAGIVPAALTRAILAWLDGLTVCDPACGSGAFLIAAYDWFEERRCGLLSDLKLADPDAPECLGDLDDWRARSAPLILRNNLYGVDLSPESVEIAQLSLWIRTARPNQPLTDLSTNFVCGNSIVSDAALDPLAFDWPVSFARVFDRGGFDAVVGNPPYVRQEQLGPFKPHLATHYRAYHGMADLYVYFYEKGLSVLKPGGRLAFVVTNKWMKAGYGEPLRRFFGDNAWVESVVDFGHAKQFFKDADVFPCFLVVRKPNEEVKPERSRVCVIPRDLVRLEDLRVQIGGSALDVERERLGPSPWLLEPVAVKDLIARIRRGQPLSEFAGVKPFYGVKTGLNEAFLVDTKTRDALIQEHPRSGEIIKPYLRGQDVKRWSPDWSNLWMIFARRGIDIDRYPAVERYLGRFRGKLEPKPRDWTGPAWGGRKRGDYRWYEVQDPVEYWALFEAPKIVYQEIQYHPAYSLDSSGLYGNNKTFIIPSGDLYLLSVLNSPLMWWHNWRFLPHMKDEALTPVGFLMETIPIAQPSVPSRTRIEAAAARLIAVAKDLHAMSTHLLDWLKVEYEVAKPSQKLQDANKLDSDTFVAEVQKLRGKNKSLTSAALRGLREEHTRTIEPAQAQVAEARALERQVSDLVNAAYGLTPEDVRLMWETAPPRMPIGPPAS